MDKKTNKKTDNETNKKTDKKANKKADKEINVVDFCSDLIRFQTVSPDNSEAADYIGDFLLECGFGVRICHFIGSYRAKNVFAAFGKPNAKKRLGFLGHVDVVPEGSGWNTDPFDPVQKNGFLIGRGVADMKGGVAAFCCAVAKFLKQTSCDGYIAVFITGDEEIGSDEGLQPLLGVTGPFIPNDCLIGEPSSDVKLGDRIYIGHRGSLNVKATAEGRQGHSAYPQNYDNALMRLCNFITAVKNYEWKHEDKRFPITNAEPTLMISDNVAVNVVPGTASVNINVRFGSDYSTQDLEKIFSEIANAHSIEVKFLESGDAYCCDNENLKNMLSGAINKVTGLTPKFSTEGGTSDGRFMSQFCNVIEFGLQDATIHQANECAKISDLQALENIYFEFLKTYFAA